MAWGGYNVCLIVFLHQFIIPVVGPGIMPEVFFIVFLVVKRGDMLLLKESYVVELSIG